MIPDGHPDVDGLFLDHQELPHWHPDLHLLINDNPIDPIYVFRYVHHLDLWRHTTLSFLHVLILDYELVDIHLWIMMNWENLSTTPPCIIFLKHTYLTATVILTNGCEKASISQVGTLILAK